jgi:tetratricopeptide (TPR) repeat protein
MLAFAYNATGNTAELLKALQGEVDSGYAGTDVAKIRKTMVGVAFQAKMYDQAIDYGTTLIKSGAADGDVYTTVGQAYFQQKKFAEAGKFFGNLVADSEKAGQTPKEQHLKLQLASLDKAGDKEGAQVALEKLVRYYPTPATWNALLFTLKNEKQDPRQKLHVFRLMNETGNLKQGADISSYAEVATAVGLPAEAYGVLESALKSNTFTVDTEKARAERYLGSAKTRADADRAALAKREAEAKAAATGDLDVSLGMAQFSFGDYAKSIEALNRGITKGGLRNPADAKLTLGIAQLRANQKAEAVNTFKSIKTEDPVTQRIAKLWLMHAS